MSNAPPAPMKIGALPPAVWQRVSDLFDEVIELDERDRVAFVKKVWAKEPTVASELVALLMSASQLEKKPAVAQAPFDAALGQALDNTRANVAQSAYREGQKFGAWTLEARLGLGGMGEVWRAKRSDGLYKASAALKLLRSDMPSEKLSARFRRERVVLARLNHPNIARLLDAGVEDGQAFIVLELVEGTLLLDYVTHHAPKLDERVRLLRDVAYAVEHAHSQRVLHRDLKPTNVLVTASGDVKLLDFGIAGVLDDSNDEPMTKLTQLTGRGMTLEYASPEQISGDTTAATSDVYSLGVLLFHLCTGNRPFAGTTTRATLEYAMINSEPPLASVHITTHAAARGKTPVASDQIATPLDADQIKGELDAIIQRAMRRAPSDRYPSAADFADALDLWMSPRTIIVEHEAPADNTQQWMRKHWNITALIGVSTLAIVTVLGLSLWQRNVALSNADIAMRQLDRVMAQLPMGTTAVTADSDSIIEIKLQHIALLLHSERPSGALRAVDELTPSIIAKYGRTSANYGKLLLLRADALHAMNRRDDAMAAEADAAKLGVKR
jgi:eukaryotic-like serine/threonine-protein kinase